MSYANVSYIGNQPFTEAIYNNVPVSATEGQTTFNVNYQPGFVDVLVNGLELSRTDYVAADGTSVVLNEPLSLNDLVVFKVWGTFEVADTYTQAQVDANIASLDNEINKKAVAMSIVFGG